jgi:hypothetical protein
MSKSPLLPTDCRVCGSSQTMITPTRMLDYFTYRAKIKCLSCGAVRFITVNMPQDSDWDMAEQNKEKD